MALRLLNIDPLDGRGRIQVAVDSLEADRLHRFVMEATRLFDKPRAERDPKSLPEEQPRLTD